MGRVGVVGRVGVMGRVGVVGRVGVMPWGGLVVMGWWREGWLWDGEIPGTIEGECA